MKNHTKMKYETPQVNIVLLEMEHGIAAGSATINPGNPNPPFTPEVEDWKVGPMGDIDFDI